MKKEKKAKALNTDMCPICKKRKTAVIENWIGIDRIIFDKNKAKDVLDKDQLKEYREFKNAFLLNLFEIYSDLNHVSFASHKDTKHLEDYAITKAELALEHAKNVLKLDEVKSMLKEEIALKTKDNDSDDVRRKIVKENLLKTALDSFLFDGLEEDVPTLNESERGKLLIGAHRKLRDTLVESGVGRLVTKLAKHQSQSIVKKALTSDPVVYGGATAAGIAVSSGLHKKLKDATVKK